MTKAQDIRELLQEHGGEPGEHKRLAELSDALDETLSREVPHRPEFRADLRQQLMAQARRQLVPWYRRPTVWGPSLGVAAAALVLTFGLRLWQDSPLPETGPTSPPRVAQGEKPSRTTSDIDPNEVRVQPGTVANLSLPVLRMPDEVLSPEHPGAESIAALNWQQGLPVFVVKGRPSQAQVESMARALKFTEPVTVTQAGYQVSEDGRRLLVTSSGQVSYEDRTKAPANGGTVRIDADAAQQLARHFLDDAALPVPSLPTVASVLDPQEGTNRYVITYSHRVDDRPVVNGRTVIHVSEQGQVLNAEAYVQANEEQSGRYAVLGPADALKRAQSRGGAVFDTVDLVYVRTVEGEAVYLQPYWRTFGADGQGNRLARYISALIPEQ